MSPRLRARASSDVEVSRLGSHPRFRRQGSAGLWRSQQSRGPMGRAEGREVGAPTQPPTFLRSSKPRRLPWVPAAVLGDLVLRDPTSRHQQPPRSRQWAVVPAGCSAPQTQKLTKTTGHMKRHFLPSALVSEQFPPCDVSPDPSRHQGPRQVCAGHTGASPLQHHSPLLESEAFSRDTRWQGTSVGAIGCQHPTCHAGTQHHCRRAPAPRAGTDPSVPQGFTLSQESSGGKKPSYHVQQLRLRGGERQTRSEGRTDLLRRAGGTALPWQPPALRGRGRGP